MTSNTDLPWADEIPVFNMSMCVVLGPDKIPQENQAAWENAYSARYEDHGRPKNADWRSSSQPKSREPAASIC